MTFRTEKLWTLDVDDVLKVNQEGLEKVIEYFKITYKKRYMGKKEAIKLMCTESAVGVFEKDANYCYGMSKMTVLNEVKQSKKYDKLELPEFNEYIGRIADFKYKDQADFTLGQKIEFVLDDIFRLINYKRNEKGAEAEE